MRFLQYRPAKYAPDNFYVYTASLSEEKGNAEFLIGDGRYVLSEGTGIFINTRVIHRFEATESAIIPNVVFSPSLLSPEESLMRLLIRRCSPVSARFRE